MAQNLTEDLNIVAKSNLEIELLDGDLNIIQKLDDEPNDVGGMTSAELKETFDKAGNIIKDYLNNQLIPAILAADATEAARAEAEAARQSAETGREQAEAERVSAEETRASDEETRQSNETARKNAEATREDAEKARAEAEGQRASAEVFRFENERIRQENEALRQSVETGYIAQAADYANRAASSASESEKLASAAEAQANRAQAEADRATVPAIAGIYNIIIPDRNTGEKYAVLMEGGNIFLLGVSADMQATDMLLVDSISGKSYRLCVENKLLTIEED